MSTDDMLTEDKLQRCARIMFGPQPIPVWVMKSVFEKLPADTVMFRHMEDPRTGQFGWFVASNSFAKVDEGAEVPKINVKADGTTKEVEVLKETSFLDELESL